MSLSELVDEVKEGEKTLTVFTRAEDDRLVAEVEQFFEVQNITVRWEHVDPESPKDFVVLHQDGDPVAVSTLADVRDSLFLHESDPETPADTSLSEAETPDVVNSLGNTTFAADGDDGMLLTQLSHYIVELAYETGAGRLHVGVGTLPDLGFAVDSRGVVEKLVRAGVEVHVYGDDGDAEGDGVVLHDAEGESTDCRFVAFDGGGEDARKAAMVAVDPEDGRYRGFWTFEVDLVDDVTRFVETEHGTGRR
jgi:hypothetical protein